MTTREEADAAASAATQMWKNFDNVLKQMSEFVNSVNKNKALPTDLRIAALDAYIGLMKMHVIVNTELIRGQARICGMDMEKFEADVKKLLAK